MSMQDKVKRGAEWLDTVYPEWYDHIDTSAIEMRSGFSCVLGQAFSTQREFDGETFDVAGYDLVCEMADASDLDTNTGFWMVEHGFTHEYWPSPTDWYNLGVHWTREIEARK